MVDLTVPRETTTVVVEVVARAGWAFHTVSESGRDFVPCMVRVKLPMVAVKRYVNGGKQICKNNAMSQ